MVAPIAQRLACVVDDGDNTDITTSNVVNGAKTTTIITPRPSEKPLHSSIITPDQNETKNDAEVNNHCCDDDGGGDATMSSPRCCNCQEVKEARRDAQQSAKALDDLVTAIRYVKRILERQTPTGTDVDDRRIHDDIEEELAALSLISESLHGVLGSDLLGLLNAADMVRTHSKLAMKEASALVNDVAEARNEAWKAQESLRTTKKIARSLHKENRALKKEVRQLQSQRKVLVREVKVLRDNAEVTKQYDTWRLLENHVLNALTIHEKVLKTPTEPKFTDFSPSDVTTTTEQPPLSVTSSSSSNAFENIESVPSSDSESESDSRRCQPEEQSLVEIPEASISDDYSNNEQAATPKVNGNENPPDDKKDQETSSHNTDRVEKTTDKSESATTSRGSVTLSGFADGFTGGLRSFFGSNSSTPKTTRTPQQDTTPQRTSESKKVEEGQSDLGTSSLVPDTTTEQGCSDSSRVVAGDIESVEGSSNHKEDKLPNSKNDTDPVAITNPCTPTRPKNSREHRLQPNSPGSKSNVPGLEEISGCCTDETFSSATVQTRDSEEGCSKFPTEFSVQIPSANREPCSSTNCFASPLISPAESPSGVVSSQPKPMCDEKILRTLAIPSGDRHVSKTSGKHTLHPRKELESDKTELESGLYEC